jgi:hypothetical protein
MTTDGSFPLRFRVQSSSGPVQILATFPSFTRATKRLLGSQARFGREQMPELLANEQIEDLYGRSSEPQKRLQYKVTWG